MATASQLPKDQVLPQREAASFKQVLKMYENRQYKTALKICNQILKKFPENGETLSMKGLTMGSMDGMKEEAYQFVKMGLTKTKCKSHVCWHVYGLLHRTDKNYEQAIKCYRNALNIDPENMQILRDLSILQIHCMDTAGLVQTRHKILELKPSHKPNWLGFALAHHLHQNYATALKVLDSVEPPDTKYEISELKMYRNMIIFESGDLNGCLEDLEQIRSQVLDNEAWMECRTKCLIQAGRLDDARATLLQLLRHNADNRNYLLQYIKTLHPTFSDWKADMSISERNDITNVLLELESSLPKSQMLKRVILDTSHGDLFIQRFKEFVKPYLRKTIPSLSSALKSLYCNRDKVSAMDRILNEWEISLKANNKFPEEEGNECPTTFLWLLMLKAAHLYRTGDFSKALQYVNDALTHTPTVEMLYILKGRILKHMGQPGEAVDAMEKARLLDTSDRFLNTKVVKYHLRNNNIKAAEKTAALFAAPNENSKEPPVYNVPEMQWMFYEIEEGDAYLRLGDVVTALKKWLLIDKHFQDIEEDQFDFHTYCLRKCTMRAYVDMLRFERRSRGHKVYLKAAERIIKGYLQISEALKRGEDVTAKVLHLATKDAKSNEAGADAAAAAAAAHKKGGKGAEPEKDEEAEGDEEEEKAKEIDIQVDLKDPLGAATPFVKVMVQYAPKEIESHRLAAEVYTRREKPLLAIKSLIAGLAIDRKHETLNALAKQVVSYVSENSGVSEAVKAAVKELKPQLGL